MNNQDKEILEKYLKDIKRKRVFFFIIVLVSIASIGCCILYENYKKIDTNIDNFIQVDTENININENQEEINDIQEIKEVSVNNELSKENKNERNESIKNVTINKKDKKKQKPTNKEFLFTDGYNMDNVMQVAQDYLKKSGFAGQCIPIKDNEGIYLGVKVIFY